eukprot:CAMPEP_0206452008 /NCGR_PEP_ID=MMETSP0324_2-20121206/19685_1 /ASSEMBLY_ACC=CAM_ASM_000836 /TAXON_ID=2866 /ORGANISM="Crypthecodinium cohnii, Strain Seligo" /LENGTH=105 /DNA_ID=CAMNT_0053922007 /DNA_START=721 /DNA_END=1036 /DNA_ORIENTATION=+
MAQEQLDCIANSEARGRRRTYPPLSHYFSAVFGFSTSVPLKPSLPLLVAVAADDAQRQKLALPSLVEQHGETRVEPQAAVGDAHPARELVEGDAVLADGQKEEQQ